MRLLCLTLITLGLVISGYLLFRQLALASSILLVTDVCSSVFGRGCDETLRSALSSQLGIPLAGWAIVYYGTIATVLLLGWGVEHSFESEATLAALVLAIVAALMSLGLAGTMLTGAAPFCPMCVMLQMVNLALVLPLKRLTGRSMWQLLRSLVDGGRYILGGSTIDPAATRWKLVGLLASGLVAVVIYQWILIEVTQLRVPRPFNPQAALAEYEAVPISEVPVDANDAQVGPFDAPAQLVVFSDFQCPACRRFSQRIPDLLERFGGQLRIVFKHYPLGNACNESITRDLHPRACEASWAAEAARRQDRFWPIHDALFATNLGDTENTLEAIAEEAGLDLERFNAERTDDTVKVKVASDIELGILLGLDGTPAAYLNGRRVFDTRAQTLQFLVAHQIERSGH